MRLPRPWSRYVACHGSPRRCAYFPRWRVVLTCRLLGHRWFHVWGCAPEVMCHRCAVGPLDPADLRVREFPGGRR